MILDEIQAADIWFEWWLLPGDGRGVGDSLGPGRSGDGVWTHGFGDGTGNGDGDGDDGDVRYAYSAEDE